MDTMNMFILYILCAIVPTVVAFLDECYVH